MENIVGFRLASMIASVLTLIVLVMAPQASAKPDLYDMPEPVAIQGRRYQIDQSFRVALGYSPIDSFNRGYPLSVAYRYQLSPYLTWEVIDYSQILHSETKTKRDLQNLGINVTNVGLGGVLDYPVRSVLTGFNYSPIYSKNLLFNKTLLYSETNLYLGVGALIFNAVGLKPCLVPGLDWRLYITPKTAMSLYIRDQFYSDSSIGFNGILSFGIGFEFKFHLTGSSNESASQ